MPSRPDIVSAIFLFCSEYCYIGRCINFVSRSDWEYIDVKCCEQMYLIDVGNRNSTNTLFTLVRSTLEQTCPSRFDKI